MEPKVLIVDDTMFNRKIMKDVLKRHIQHVIYHEAENGMKALDAMAEEDFDLIILDLIMPVMDGFAFLQHIQDKEEYMNIPVIVFSAADEIENVQKALQMGVYDYVIRPLSREQSEMVLPLKVRNALNSYEQKKMLIKANQELNQQMEIIRERGNRDSLTRIYNRMYFDQEMERLDACREQYFPISVLVIDLDGVKIINDVFGHTVGDELIKNAAEIIRKPFRKGDVLARLGGDEFGILLPYSDEIVCKQKEKEILKAIEDYNHNDPIMPISMSIGVATGIDGIESVQEIYHRADRQMYEKKLNKSGHYHREMAEKLISTLLQHEEIESITILERMDQMMERLRFTKNEMKNILADKKNNRGCQ